MNTTYFLNVTAGNVFGSMVTPALPSNYYLGLSTQSPNVDGTNVIEPSASNGYSRVLIESLGSPVNGVVSNQENISFNESTGNWGTITHFVIFDTESVDSGNLLMYGELSNHRVVEPNTIMTIRSGYLELSVQNPV